MPLGCLSLTQYLASPSFRDHLLATQLGEAATEFMTQGKRGVLAWLIKDDIALTPLAKVVSKVKEIDLGFLKLAMILAK